MSILDRAAKWWKRRHFNLRQACIDKYGPEFGEKYDSLCEGCPIGGLSETIKFIEMVEEVKKENSI